MRDKIFSFPGQQPENPNFGQRNFAQQFRFIEQTDYTSLAIPSAAETLGLLRLHHSTRSLPKSLLSLNFRSKMIFMKNALIMTLQNVQAHHGQPVCVTSESKKRPLVKCKEYLCRHRKKFGLLPISNRWRNNFFLLLKFRNSLQWASHNSLIFNASGHG